VLDGFRTGDYTIRRQHYAKLLAIPLPVPVIVIRGFTDNQSDAVSNRGLSLSRAIEVQQWLTLRNGGRPIARNIIVEAFGAALPVAPNSTEAGRSRNRRVEILLCQAPPPPPPPPLIASILRVQMGGNAG
jgi:flagellar motor protein MotB